MNVPLLQPRLRVLLYALLFIIVAQKQISAQGQRGGAYTNIVTALNTEVTDTVAGVNLSLSKVNPLAKHGKVTLKIIQSGGSGNPYVYKISYLPDPGFIGVDTFALQFNYVGSYPFLTYRGYRVSVYPSLATARPDFAVTTAGLPVEIDVLANDTGNSLSIQSIPLVNSGTAIVNASNRVVFTPSPGFVGIAHANYVVCDAYFNCKTAQINIGVNDGAPANDTLHVATAKNISLSIPLTYSGFTLFQSPSKGVVFIENGQAFRYLPNSQFTGTDQFVLVNESFNPPIYKTVVLDVLNTPTQNTMAMDDYVFTPKGQPLTFNVRDNDIGNLLVKSWVPSANFPGTLSNTLGNGKVTFTPNADFTGVATFQYRIGNSNVPNLETGTVNVFVGNLNPVLPTFELTTPKATPFVVNYQIPFTGFNFSVIEKPDNGTCSFFPGYSTQNLNGQIVSGHNLLIYTPKQGFAGLDEFSINYCVTANSQCKTVKIAMNVVNIANTEGPFCVENCVWAGDVNKDGIVNNKDLLPLGYFMGFEGQPRENAPLLWYGQFADAWDNPFTSSSIDLKHADTDGDGVITTDDTSAINLFYGRQDNLFPHVPTTSKNLPFALKVLTPNPHVGDLVRVQVSLGNVSLPLTNLYGFTFDLSLGPIVEDSALQMTYFDNSWLNLNSPSLWLTNNPRQGRLETAFTRTAGHSADGYGVVGELSFIIIDIVDGGKPEFASSFSLTVDGPSLLSGNGDITYGESYSIEIPLGKERGQRVSDSDFFVYPSPANDRLRIHLNGTEIIESLSIFDATGRAVYASGEVSWERSELNVSSLAEGFYIASARTTNGNVAKKFQILR